MNTKIKVVGIIISLVMGGALVNAQEAPKFQEGDRTLTLSGSGSSDQSFNTSVASAQLGLGWFIADNLAFRVRQGLGFADVNGGSDWIGSTRFGIDRFLDLGRCKPFAGINLGYLYGDSAKEQFIAGPGVGISCFVNDTTFINLGVEYQFLFEDTDEAENTYDDGRFVYGLGMGVKW